MEENADSQYNTYMERITNQPNRNISQGMNGIFGSANNYQQ